MWHLIAANCYLGLLFFLCGYISILYGVYILMQQYCRYMWYQFAVVAKLLAGGFLTHFWAVALVTVLHLVYGAIVYIMITLLAVFHVYLHIICSSSTLIIQFLFFICFIEATKRYVIETDVDLNLFRCWNSSLQHC